MTDKALTAGTYPERARHNFRSANEQLMPIHLDSTDSIFRHDMPPLESIEARLLEARNRRDAAAEALKRDLREHGCSM